MRGSYLDGDASSTRACCILLAMLVGQVTSVAHLLKADKFENTALVSLHRPLVSDGTHKLTTDDIRHPNP